MIHAEALRDNLDANGKYIVRIWENGLAMRALDDLSYQGAQHIASEINKIINHETKGNQ